MEQKTILNFLACWESYKQTNKQENLFPTELFQSRKKTSIGMFTNFCICLEINASLKKEHDIMVLYEE